jgi:2'-5' RNA ligase
MRLFIAVNFDDVTKNRLLAIQGRIRAQSLKGNFSKQENLHLTVVFLGELSGSLVPEINAIVKNAVVSAGIRAFSVNFCRTGCFRHAGKELWWIAPEGNPNGNPEGNPNGNPNGEIGVLFAIRQEIGKGLDEAGIPFDRRPFKAHITLGREIKPSSPIKLPDEVIPIQVKRISLMRSENIRGALTYTELFGQDLQNTSD